MMSIIRYGIRIVILLGITVLSVGIFTRAYAQDPFMWVSSETEHNAGDSYSRVPAGKHSDGAMTYICNVEYTDSMHNGKLHRGTCYIPYGGKEHAYREYNVLLSLPNAYEWVSLGDLSRSQIEKRGVWAGRVDNGASLYVCDVSIGGGWHAGKFLSERGTCYIPYGGKEHAYDGSSSVFILMRK